MILVKQSVTGRFLFLAPLVNNSTRYWVKRPLLSDSRPADCLTPTADNKGRFVMSNARLVENERGTLFIEFNCDGCGKISRKYVSSLKGLEPHFCSGACAEKAVVYEEFNCAACGELVRDLACKRNRRGTKNRFCGPDCKKGFYRTHLSKSEKDAAHYSKHAKKIRQGSRSYYQEHAEELRAKRKQKERQLKRDVMDAYGGVCACCGETLLEFLTIDHINNDGKAHRDRVGKRGVYKDLKNRGFPQEGYRVLCFNCNTSRGYYGYCPHNPEEFNMPSKKQKGDKVGRPITVGLANERNPDAAILNEDVIIMQKAVQP